MVVHFLFIAFVLGGLAAVMFGFHARRAWVVRRALRVTHLLCVVLVVLQSWAGLWCPLTLLENRLRASAGQAGYGESFIQYWVGRIIYYDAPAWVFTLVYSLFGALVILYNVLAERRRRADATTASRRRGAAS